MLLQHSNWTELLNALSYEPRLEFVVNVRCQFLVVLTFRSLRMVDWEAAGPRGTVSL